MRTSIDGSIEIEVPAATVYEFWTRMEEFPRFIDAIESVRKIDERRSVWRVNLGFRRHGGDHGDHPGQAARLALVRRRAQRGDGQLPSDFR